MKSKEDKLNDKIGKIINDLNKDGIKEKKESFRESADKIIDNAEEGIVIMSEKCCQTLGVPPVVCAVILSSLETIIENVDCRKMYIENIKLMLERLEDNNE
jgi:hypothetical protein